MEELFQKDRLQPSLLDRLSDDKPAERAELSVQRTMTLEDYKESVLRDLEWLLNTRCLETIQPLDDYAEVKKSVLNLGMPDFSGKISSSMSPGTLERAMRQTILNFEPRILPKSLRVRVADKGGQNAVIFHIEGELWWQPVPEHLYLTSILDLEHGKVEVKLAG